MLKGGKKYNEEEEGNRRVEREEKRIYGEERVEHNGKLREREELRGEVLREREKYREKQDGEG